jgi:basic amino acid/polyamine antiporter, APA family
MTNPGDQEGALHRSIGLWGAIMMGMGSILGTGIFVSLGLAAEIAGPSVLIAIGIAALVAACNGLSSAQLAAAHPVSGGTYEYGYREVHPAVGFTAGWMFLCAKSASAATAALGFAGYGLRLIGGDASRLSLPVAMAALVLLTILVLSGMKRSNAVNIVVVSITLASLALFVLAGFSTASSRADEHLRPFFDGGDARFAGLLEAAALMFVAYTGYGRIATLGEEVIEPRRTIPRAVIVTLALTMLLYISVAVVAVASVGAEAYGAAAREEVAPLQIIAGEFGFAFVPTALAIGAVTAMFGVLLNLLLGLSRVVLAMARRRDVPCALAATSSKTGAPWAATLVVFTLIGALVLVGDVRLTWSFSAFTVLIYYAITNLCAIRLPKAQRLFPIWLAYCGLASCAFLAFWVDALVWIAGLCLIAIGLVWHFGARRLSADA